MRKLTFAILAAALAVPAFAAPNPVSEAAKPDKPKKEKKICKTMPSTKSRMGESVCKTAAEWQEQPNNAPTDVDWQKH